MDDKFFGIKKAPFIHDIWEKYQKRHLIKIKDSDSVSSRWHVHIEPYISPDDKILLRMREKGGRNDDGCKPATIKHVLGLIKRLYNWAYIYDLYDGYNPTAKIPSPKFYNETTNILEKPQRKQLLKVLENWNNQTAALIIKFALYTGCRKSEIFKLTWQDVDLNKKFIKLRDPKGKPADIPIGQKACNVLIEAEKLNRKSEYVFANRFGKKRKHFAATWRRIKQQADLPEEFRFHDFRHTFASEVISSGVGLYTLQKLLNQQSPLMTQRYAHLSDKALREAAESVDKAFD
jgi:integrase